jgi:hypothetical protein
MSLVAQRGVKDVAVAFAFTPDAPDLEDVGVPKTVSVADVSSLVLEREQTKGFRLGVYDCWIEPVGLDVRFLFCNDRDVHVASDSTELLDSIRAHWRAKGFNVYPDDLPENA